MAIYLRDESQPFSYGRPPLQTGFVFSARTTRWNGTRADRRAERAGEGNDHRWSGSANGGCIISFFSLVRPLLSVTWKFNMQIYASAEGVNSVRRHTPVSSCDGYASANLPENKKRDNQNNKKTQFRISLRLVAAVANLDMLPFSPYLHQNCCLPHGLLQGG